MSIRRLVVAMAVSALCASPLVAGRLAMQDAQKPTFTVKVEEVRVDALVSENGRPTTGLRAADFEVLDNGVPQAVNLAIFEQLPLNVVLAFDTSYSLGPAGLRDLRGAGSAILNALRKGDEAGLVTFSHIVSLASEPTADFARIRTALAQLTADGDTALVDATHTAMILAESDTARGLVIVFTDGVDTSSWLAPELALQTARRMNVVVYGIAVGSSRDTYLRDLTTATGGSLLQIESTNNLARTLLAALDEFRQRYLLSYSPRGVQATGWHRIEVRVKGRKVAVKARPGYLKGPETR